MSTTSDTASESTAPPATVFWDILEMIRTFSTKQGKFPESVIPESLADLGINSKSSWISLGKLLPMLETIATIYEASEIRSPPSLPPAQAPESLPPAPGSEPAIQLENKRCEMSKAFAEDSNKFLLKIPKTDSTFTALDPAKQKIEIAKILDAPEGVAINIKRKFSRPASSASADQNDDSLKYIIEPRNFQDKANYQKILKTKGWTTSVCLHRYLQSFSGKLRARYQALKNDEIGDHLLFKPNRNGSRLIVLHRKSQTIDVDKSFSLLETIQIPVPSSISPGIAQNASCFSKYVLRESFWECIPKTFTR